MLNNKLLPAKPLIVKSELCLLRQPLRCLQLLISDHLTFPAFSLLAQVAELAFITMTASIRFVQEICAGSTLAKLMSLRSSVNEVNVRIIERPQAHGLNFAAHILG